MLERAAKRPRQQILQRLDGLQHQQLATAVAGGQALAGAPCGAAVAGAAAAAAAAAPAGGLALKARAAQAAEQLVQRAVAAFEQSDAGSASSMLRPLRLLAARGYGGDALQVRALNRTAPAAGDVCIAALSAAYYAWQGPDGSSFPARPAG